MKRLRVGGRPLGLIARNVFAPANYRALVAMRRRYVRPLDAGRRYFLGRGEYPTSVPIRTPLGLVEPTLWSRHDMFTVHEIFARRDYAAAADDVRVVDVGSNIGISALYFLTRSPNAHCRLYEPAPTNVERLRHNLADFTDRYALEQVAVADFDGQADFGIDTSGRYGGIDIATGHTTQVPCRDINRVLEDALETWDAIDLLKLDVEGMEARLLDAIRPDLLRRIRTLYVEGRRGSLPLPDGFEVSESCETVRLRLKKAVQSRAVARERLDS